MRPDFGAAYLGSAGSAPLEVSGRRRAEAAGNLTGSGCGVDDPLSGWFLPVAVGRRGQAPAPTPPSTFMGLLLGVRSCGQKRWRLGHRKGGCEPALGGAGNRLGCCRTHTLAEAVGEPRQHPFLLALVAGPAPAPRERPFPLFLGPGFRIEAPQEGQKS